MHLGVPLFQGAPIFCLKNFVDWEKGCIFAGK